MQIQESCKKDNAKALCFCGVFACGNSTTPVNRTADQGGPPSYQTETQDAGKQMHQLHICKMQNKHKHRLQS